MGKFTTMTLTIVLLGVAGLNVGCAGRLIREGMATATGASGKVIDIRANRGLSKYGGMKIESLKVTPGIRVPSEMPLLLREHLMAAADKLGLAPGGQPALKLSCEVIHYESGGVVDAAIGPLEEVIVRSRLMDGESGELLAEANLIGRSKATTSGGPKNLSDGVGKALDKWLKESGVRQAADKAEQ